MDSIIIKNQIDKLLSAMDELQQRFDEKLVYEIQKKTNPNDLRTYYEAIITIDDSNGNSKQFTGIGISKRLAKYRAALEANSHFDGIANSEKPPEYESQDKAEHFDPEEKDHHHQPEDDKDENVYEEQDQNLKSITIDNENTE